MAVYFLRFEKPAGDPSRARMSASYYVGYADDEALPQRVKLHRSGVWEGAGGGSPAKLPTWFRENGIGFRVVRVLWGASRDDERRIKRAGNYHRWDPRGGRLYAPAWWKEKRVKI